MPEEKKAATPDKKGSVDKETKARPQKKKDEGPVEKVLLEEKKKPEPVEDDIVEKEETKAKKEEPVDIEEVDSDESIEADSDEADSIEPDEEEGYKVKAKPELAHDERQALSNRAAKRSKKPNFRRQEWFRYVRVSDSWRKPRGMHSKMRRNFRYRPPKVSTGYRGPKMVRGRHPSGFEDILVHNPKDLEGLDPKKQAVRIGHTVGTRKRNDIKVKADELGIRILNWGA